MFLPLFLLKRVDEVMYDEAEAFVIAAKNPKAARELIVKLKAKEANGIGGDEPPEVWLDPKLSRCTKIATFGRYRTPKVVLDAFRAG